MGIVRKSAGWLERPLKPNIINNLCFRISFVKCLIEVKQSLWVSFMLYIMSVGPAACLTWGLTDMRVTQDVKLIIIFIYWSSFSVGVLPYVLTNKRIRDAFIRFASDTLLNFRLLNK